MTLAREDVVVIGAGQAGLATSYELTQRGVDHVVLERGRVGQSWRDRWDSFCLVLPNWTLKLPGYEFAGDDPDAFLPRDGIVRYMEAYAGKAGRIPEGINVSSLQPGADGGFVLGTDEGEIQARRIVLSTGAYQRPHRPPAAGTLPTGMHVIDAEGYTNPGALPEGGVLVVGSGQTGCQIAEEIQQSGRETFLACGKAPWVPRRVGARDTIAGLTDTPLFEQPVSALPSPLAKLTGNPQASGRDGGHDLHFRTLQAIGVQLLGRFDHADASMVHFGSDLAESVTFGDSRYADIKNLIHGFCASNGMAAPDIPDPPAFDPTAPQSIELARPGTVGFTSGFTPDYSRWVDIPTFDEMCFPLPQEGQSMVAPRPFFVGVHFRRKRKP